MPSQSTRHILASIAIAAAVGKMVSEQANNHFAKNAAIGLETTSMEAMRKWPEKFDVTPRQLEQIAKDYQIIDGTGFFKIGETHEVLTACSMLASILVDCHAKLKHPKKKELISSVILALSGLNRFFAPAEEGEKEFKLYDIGAEYADMWRKA